MEIPWNTQKWMLCNWTSYENGWFGSAPSLGNLPNRFWFGEMLWASHLILVIGKLFLEALFVFFFFQPLFHEIFVGFSTYTFLFSIHPSWARFFCFPCFFVIKFSKNQIEGKSKGAGINTCFCILRNIHIHPAIETISMFTRVPKFWCTTHICSSPYRYIYISIHVALHLYIYTSHIYNISI